MNHVVVGAAVNSSAVVAAGCIEAESARGLMLGFNFDPIAFTITVNGIPVTDFDIEGDYGVLHGIESVLVPGVQGDFIPCPAFEADFSPISEKGIYSTLLGAVVQTGNDAVISASAPVTIFGPKDSAFAEIQTVVDGLTNEQLSEILLNHVIVGAAVDSSTVVEAGCIDAVAASGMDLAIRYNATTMVADVNGIVINDFDIQGDYGIMHGMEGVLTDSDGHIACPIPSVVEQVAATGNYTTLLGYLGNPMLQGQLESVGPISKYRELADSTVWNGLIILTLLFVRQLSLDPAMLLLPQCTVIENLPPNQKRRRGPAGAPAPGHRRNTRKGRKKMRINYEITGLFFT